MREGGRGEKAGIKGRGVEKTGRKEGRSVG
jgi:hypothetical protein